MKKYTIKKGKHYSGIHFCPFVGASFEKKIVKFDSSCINTVDVQGWNKVFGLGFGFNHHNNSARFGWRCDGNKIKLSTYCYVDKNRINPFTLGLFDTDQNITLSIKVKNNEYIFKVESPISLTHIVSKNKTANFGYRLFPYFGGDLPAPHKMYIFMENV